MATAATKTVAERAIEYLKAEGGWKRPRTVAEAIDSGTDYTRDVLNDLYGEDKVQKREKGIILGTRISGDWKVIDSREQAISVIRIHGDAEPDGMASMTLNEVRSYIRTNIAEATGVLNKKVWFKRD
ncbi:hypothetical protein [Salinigranum halophilum]|jgi:hypothetical protein|uniref:hypothetical protein n=1 Tax=Salinigranum halophilum TaxID=2565931 RepID=UPI00115E9A1D|nr:hypothetical protein [Salinigranum halophilum]